MKIERSKLKKSSSEVPSDCKSLIERLRSTGGEDVSFLRELKRIETWTYGKCELLHWIDVLDLADRVLERSCVSSRWSLVVDSDSGLKELVLWTLHFTTLLIEHSFSRHLYSSMEHLTALLSSSDLDVVLAVLNLLYMFSKRSNFITRLSPEKRGALLSRLNHLAASWGGKDNGFGLKACCSQDASFPSSATTLHFEFSFEKPAFPPSSNLLLPPTTTQHNKKNTSVIHMERVDALTESPGCIMADLLDTYPVPLEKHMLLFTYLRLAHSFADYNKRLKCVQARLQALSVLIYSNQLSDNVQSLLYSGLLEELVEVLEMKGDHLMEIKAAALKSLTSIIHLDRNPNFPKLNTIIDVTGASSYHGFLPVLVRSCIASLTAPHKEGGGTTSSVTTTQSFPQPLATALFSFLYHLASYEAGGEALVSCGMMESLLKVIQWPSTELDHITFVTRAVRVIDLITNLDMQSFQTHSGLSSFIVRLELEVEHCREQQPFEIIVGNARREPLTVDEEFLMDTSESGALANPLPPPPSANELMNPPPDYSAAKTGLTCLPQRAALLKSMLNFLKKAIQDTSFVDSIRHVMDGSLPNSLKHIISNAEYYGPSLFLLATDVVTAYVFQEPSLLSSLQDKGLTDVVLHALLVKDVPATREVLGSLPNVFSALCLNTRGLDAFVACKPFERLFKVLLSPVYLTAMRRRRSSDHMDTASSLGNAMDELMRHQPLLKEAATGAIIKLLEEVCALGRDTGIVCWKAFQKNEAASSSAAGRTDANNAVEPSGSSDEEEEEDEEAVTSVSSQQQTQQPPGSASSSSTATPSNSSQPNTQQQQPQASSASQQQQLPVQQQSSRANTGNNSSNKEAVPLVDYVHNVMKFVEAILSNNSTGDHCREFVTQKGLVPLMGILGLPNLPIDFPTHQACQSVAAVCKSILNLAHEPQVLKQGLLHLNEVLINLEPLHTPLEAPGGSVLLHELTSASNIAEATSNSQATPLLHHMSAAHAYIQMFIYVCRTGQNDIRTISVNHWGSELGLDVLKGLSKLFASLVWESTILLALCSDDTLPPNSEFGKADMDKLLPSQPQPTPNEQEETLSPSSGTESNSSVTMAMENLSTEPEVVSMDVDGSSSSEKKAPETTTTSSKYNPCLHHQIKQIKPLLSASSRLGRALAELFALLVKLCVGSPIRQRRGQHVPPTPSAPSSYAIAVASALNKLLASGLSWSPPPTSPIPGFRLTFFTCSVGFTPPMLFDDKKFPYHLMLMKFVNSGGLKAFFETFNWALSCGGKLSPEEGLESKELPEGTGEFLDSWLMLLERMVNPKAVLESPHTLPNFPIGNFVPFDPVKYLIRTHKLAFQAVMKIWGKSPLKVYGPRMAGSVLSILCHILKGEKVIAEKLAAKNGKAEEDKSGVGGGAAVPTRIASRFASSPPFQMRLPYFLEDSFLSSVGNAAAETAAAAGPGGANTATTTTSSSSTSDQQPHAPPRTGESAAGGSEEAGGEPAPGFSFYDLQILMDMGFSRERCLEAMERTGAMYEATEYLLTVSSSASGTQPPPPVGGQPAPVEQEEMPKDEEHESEEEDQDDEEAGEGAASSEASLGLSKSIMDEFTAEALPGCLSLVDTLPGTVFRTCDLLLAVFGRNGKEFKENILRELIAEVKKSIDSLLIHLNGASSPPQEDLFRTEESSKAAVRIHLFILLFEECKLLCAKIVEESEVVPNMTRLLSVSFDVLKSSEGALGTPKWMTPLLLFIDLHEKVILGMNRRVSLTSVCSRYWKWYDISSGRWNQYTPVSNRIIDDAFWSGETSVRITTGRRKYTIQFGTMIQTNEETGNRRPIMISIKSKESRESGKSGASSGSASNAMELVEDEKKVVDPYEEDVVTTVPTAEGLRKEDKSALLKACVGFVSIPVDSDALNAVLRLCLRLTQDFDMAVDFARLGGVKLLLELNQSSLFSGITSLATLLVRHVLEDPATLRHTMEKVIRTSTLNSQTTSKEINYILRVLAPAACRCPSIFVEVAKDVLRFDPSLLNKRVEPEEDNRLLVKSIPAKGGSFSPTLGEVSQSVICDLLNFLVKSSPPEPSESGSSNMATNNETPSESKSIASTTTTTTNTTASRSQSSSGGVIRNISSGDLPGVLSEAPPPTPAETPAAPPPSKDNKKPFLSKSAVCRLLAELVKSYGGCAKLITDHVYEAGIVDNITEDTSALAFLLDELLTSKADKDIGQLVKTLIAALASCNHQPEAQSALVYEVKQALHRALGNPESPNKHAKIQALTCLISTMIESCPSSALSQNNAATPTFKQNLQCQMNNIVKIMLKRGLITDLARVPHSLDLSSPSIAVTINSALKPLETLSRIVNQPTALVSSARKSKSDSPAAATSNEAISGSGGTTNAPSSGLLVDIPETESSDTTPATNNEGNNSSNSEATRAIGGDETGGGDPEATEHDVSTAAESIDPSSESQLLQAIEDEQNEDFDEMMDQLLDRDGSENYPIIAGAVEHHSLGPNGARGEGDSQDDDRVSESSQSDAAIEEETEDIIEDEEEEEEEEGEEEDDEDEDEDEDEEDEEDEEEGGGSPYNEEDHEEDFRGVEGATYRMPSEDPIDEYIDRMVFQNIDTPLRSAIQVVDPAIMHPIPLWSAGVNGAGEPASAHVTPSHPLLMGRSTLETGGAAPPRNNPAAPNSSSRALPRTRGGNTSLRPYFQINSRANNSGAAGTNNPSTPAILQNFLGGTTNPQEFVTFGFRRSGAPLMMDVVGLSLLDSMGNGMPDLDSANLSSGGRAALSSIPSALLRWNEESRVIDGESMHDCVTNLKPDIMEVIEATREEDRKKKDEQRKMIKKLMIDSGNNGEDTEEEGGAVSNTAADLIAVSTPLGTGSSPIAPPPSETINTTATERTVLPPPPSSSEEDSVPSSGRQAISQLAQDLAAAISTRVGSLPAIVPPLTTTSSLSEQATTPPAAPRLSDLPTVLDPLSPSPEVTANSQNTPVNPAAVPLDPTSDVPMEQPASAGNPEPSTSGTSDFRSILGDVDIPEGVDPSFLAALPEEMRQEVIDDQRRLQNIRQRAQQQNTEGSNVPEVNPEFLAALPPNIQEEVLAQQRMEQQRQLSQVNPGAPVDPGEFFQTLPASLRQSVLADMEDSQMAALPAELAAEAQSLRREYEQRNRNVMQDRFFNNGAGGGGNSLSSILRGSVSRLGNQYIIGNLVGREAFRLSGSRFTEANAAAITRGGRHQAFLANSIRFKGRQLLDNEGLSCLLILLFVDDSKINTTRLHRILRNLCYHAPTRDWVVRCLVSILDRANETKESTTTALQPKAKTTHRSTPAKSSSQQQQQQGQQSQQQVSQQQNNSWLNISMDAALGFRANVFQVHRSSTPGKKSNEKGSISIRSGASAVVCRHTLEVLISLAKNFSIHFLPWGDQIMEKYASPEKKKTAPTSLSSATTAGVPGPMSDFWDTLLRLDSQSSSRKGKSVARSHSSSVSGSVSNEEETCLSIDSSPFGKLLSMLKSPVIRRNSLLTDKLLRLLSLISIGRPEKEEQQQAKKKEDQQQEENQSKQGEGGVPPPLSADHLRLAVDVLTSKSCSEEGLEDVTALLLNLSHGPPPTRDIILQLLLRGAQELGNVVRLHVLDLQSELLSIKATHAEGGEQRKAGGGDKGGLLDRFTKENVVLNAPSKLKGGSELQLPSMNALTNKTSSQAFFLRVLKVIIQLREAALLAMKKEAEAAKAATTQENSTTSSSSNKMDVDEEEEESSTTADAAAAAATTTPSSNPPSASSSSPQMKLESLSEELSLETLWEALGDCLKDLAETPDHHAVLVLQSSVEAFFLVHAASTTPQEKKKVQQKETRQEQLAHIQEQLADQKEIQESSSSSSSSSSASTASPLSPDTEKFLAFAETHRTVLNQILRQSTTHLADGPFSVLVDHTRVLDFDIKRRYFRTELERMDERLRREDLAVHVRRENVFEESFRELHRRSPEEWKNRFYIVFEGEEGQDAGGLLREWYVIISREIFNPMYALFKTSPGDKVTYMIYESSQTNPNHLDYFKFVGRVIAKAIYDNKLLECYFTRSFYKHILGKPVKYTDMESEDYAFYKGLEFLVNNKVSDLGYDLTFSTEIQEFGVTEIRDLIPNGRNITVTEETKLDYIRLVCQMKMTGAIRKQLSAFLEGFYNIIPRRLISIFNEQELELLLSGLPTIDIDDLKSNTDYHKYQRMSLQIIWFWRALRSFDQTDKAKFMQFVTGSSKVPLQGFAYLEGMNGVQKFQIHRDDRSTDRLPSAHTCFNQLDLPAYETYDKLRTYLLKAIHECSEGFGFA